MYLFSKFQFLTRLILAKVCDLSIGEWVPNSAGPAYTNKTCNRIPQHNNCLKNGRPDRGYLYWRWKPRFCDLPPFDPVTFLDAMRHKSWAFIGDSIYQNHVHSLLCQLSQVIYILISTFHTTLISETQHLLDT